jgi:hypothetical protein
MIRPTLNRFASAIRFKPRPKPKLNPNTQRAPPNSLHSPPINQTPHGTPPSPPPRQIPRVMLSQFIVINVSILLFTHLFSTHVYSISATWGASMLPTMYLSGEYILIQKRNRRGRGIVVGDVVCARHPTSPAETVVKRVLGMPGDFVGSGEVDGGGNLIQVCCPQTLTDEWKGERIVG